MTTATATTRPRRRIGLARACAALMAVGFVFGPLATRVLPGADVEQQRQRAAENRTARPAPDLADGWDALNAVGPWAADRLPVRASAVRANLWLNREAFGEVPLTGIGAWVGPAVITGGDGYLFANDEFRSACWRSRRFLVSLGAILRLAEIIESSGRKVAVVVGPDKASVLRRQVPRTVPAGDCAKVGIVRQMKAMDSVKHPLWVDLRTPLAESVLEGRPPFWHTDTHWNSVGSAIAAQTLAEYFDPALANRLRVVRGSATRVGDLTRQLGLNTPETGQAAAIGSGGRVIPEPGYDQYDPRLIRVGEQRWRSQPADGLIQGRSLLLGDSFTYYALGNLRPLFAEGRFQWTGRFQQDDVVDAIAAADTVVLEVVERRVGLDHMFAKPEFQSKVATALGVTEP